jgi:hypothetical protein
MILQSIELRVKKISNMIHLLYIRKNNIILIATSYHEFRSKEIYLRIGKKKKLLQTKTEKTLKFIFIF